MSEKRNQPMFIHLKFLNFVLRAHRRERDGQSNEVACFDEERRCLIYCQSYENCDTSFRGILFHEYGITFAFLAVSVEFQK